MVLPAEEVVDLVYNLLLQRPPEPAALQHWSDAITRGLTRDQFVQAVLASREFRTHLGIAEALWEPHLTRYLRRELNHPMCSSMPGRSRHRHRTGGTERALLPVERRAASERAASTRLPWRV